MTHQHQTAFETIVGKEEIARNEQFLLFPQCFLLNQITVSTFVHIFDIVSLFAAELEEPKIAIMRQRVNDADKEGFLTHSHTMTPFDAPGKQAFENTVGKGEIAHDEQFLLFPQCFLLIWITFCHFLQI